MNCNQNAIRPEINPPANGNHGIGKLRRKLGLTFVLSNPFKVPVSQAPIPSAAPGNRPVKKVEIKSI